MNDHERRGSEVEKLAGTANDLVDSLEEGFRMALSSVRCCLSAVLAYVGLCLFLAFLNIPFEWLERRIGSCPALLLLTAAVCAIIALWRRWRRRRGRGIQHQGDAPG